MGSELRKANWRDRLLHSLGRRRGFIIEGESMIPTLNPGDAVLVAPKARLAIGDILVAKHPYKTSVTIVKRLTEILPDGALILKGDNPLDSTDSRSFGSISADNVIGKVVCRIK